MQPVHGWTWWMRSLPRAGGVQAGAMGAFVGGFWRIRRLDRCRGHPVTALTGKQRRHLRSLGHHLEPVVQLGKQGLTDGVIAAVDAALEQFELIKVRLGTECPDDREEVAERLAPAVKSEVAQTLGRTVLLYRRPRKNARIQLPEG